MSEVDETSTKADPPSPPRRAEGGARSKSIYSSLRRSRPSRASTSAGGDDSSACVESRARW
jgi:hypothetical protein